jgi:photosystem II stability/assembly factor-like uncharacterized protein
MNVRIHRSIHFITAMILALAGVRGSLPGQSADKVKSLFTKIQWRGIGPALMGGRTVDFDVVESLPSTIYAAIGPSGVWKTENNGVTWAPVFFKEATVSAGDVAIAQSNPSIVWVGTGEATCRNSVTIGDGVYKSIDAGKTWTNMGLRETRHISRIIINRGDPNIVLVAAMGHLWGPNSDRGVYRTTDGGKTWAKVLYVNDNTGFADLAQDSGNSLVLYAAGYEYRRWAYDYMSGGPGSGLYKSEDGGATWKRLAKDLPQGIMGRIGIGTARSRPGVVYALIEHKDAGIWRSEDCGESWKRTCDTPTCKRVNSRPFYYSQIHVDPADDKTVYVSSTGLFVSNDMGQKFRAIGAGIHPDHHGFWIDPGNPLHLLDGNDGGIDISYDGGKSWLGVQSMDLAEVYQVGFDQSQPYGVFCGLQDNGSWSGPSLSFDPRGIGNGEWSMVNGGDGFFVRPDPSDPDTVYSNSQMNGLQRLDRKIWRSKSVRPTASLKTPPYRFNWNSPISISPHDPKTVYCGGQFLFRTKDGGDSWDIISPDLTTNNPAKQKDAGGPISFENSGAEVHCTIVTISESPAAAGVIWCGTDDGNLQLTRDGGKSWANVAPAIPGLPKFTWCSRVEASHFDPGTAYAAFDGHRNDDYAAYLYKTADFGKTWKSLRANLPFGWVHVVREDLKNRNLLFAGTEFGVFASLDAGASWFSLLNNLPTVAVNDIAIHPRENDLIIGTHGRGVWIMDDIAFLQGMSEDLLGRDYFLFPPRPVSMYYTAVKGEPYSRPDFLGKNPPAGGLITTWLKSELKDKVKMNIKDDSGRVVSDMNLAQGAGVQRDVWNLQFVPEAPDGKKYPAAGSVMGALPTVKPGIYTLEVDAGGVNALGTIEVRPDPRIGFREDQWTLQTRAVGGILLTSKKMALAVTVARTVRRHLDSVLPEIDKMGEKGKTLRSTLDPFLTAFSRIERGIVPGEFEALQATLEGALRGGSLSIQILTIASSIASFPQAPTVDQTAEIAEISALVDGAVAGLNGMIKTDIPRLNEALKAGSLKPFPDIQEIKVQGI